MNLKSTASRVMLMVSKAVVKLIDDSGGLQTLQIALLAHETRDKARRYQQYGFSGKPHSGAVAVVVFEGGSRDHPLVIAVDDPRFRVRGLEDGEVVVYDDLGQEVRLTRAGIIVKGAGKPITITDTPKVRIETPMLECTGEIKDLCDGDGKTMSGMRSVFNEHDHSGDSGGMTGKANQEM